mmetsp:Transcript_12767/g.20804  ORF Transcript_12767/g.20804 Transcript_12767/m.20804 type:complete len:335 (-) Transcript_12767:469-1473(-)
MKLSICSAMVALAGATPRSPVSVSEKEALWRDFKADFQKQYATPEEEAAKFNIFVANLDRINSLNAAETGSAVYGVTKFADISQKEFEATFLTATPPSPLEAKPSQDVTHVPAYNGTASLVDWTGVYTTPVKDQGYCGSCWAFSATEQIESDAMRQHNSAYVLSVNQMLQCALRENLPCRGGWTEAGYEYVRREGGGDMSGGLETAEDYPYEDVHMADCKVTPRKEVVGVHRFTTIRGETNMANYVKSTGPLSVCLSAGGWEFYQSGIVETCPKVVNHCVQAVGVDDSEIGGYWKVRNSYGANWGEGGYIRLAYGQNTCFITRDPTYTDTFLVN